MSDRKYWTRRAVRYERDWNKRCAETVEKRLARHYEKTLTEIKNDILQLYATFAKDNGLDFNEARRALSSREFREWRMSVSEYLEANDAGLTRELNTLAMRPRITRLEKLYGDTLQELDKLGRKVDDDIRNFLSDAYKANYSRDIFDLVKVGGLAVALAKVDSSSVEKVLAARWSGKNYSQRIWTNTRLLSGVVRETIATGIHRGLSIPQLSRMVEDKMHGGYSNAVRLVRTEMNFVNNQAHADSMSAAGIGWYEFIAVLDNRTSAPCRSRDGEAYPLEEKSVGFNYPPLHPRCRSTVAPYIEGASKRGTRIAKVGKDTIHIPASMSYRDYETVYVKKTQTFEQWQAGKRTKPTSSDAKLFAPLSESSNKILSAPEQNIAEFKRWLTGLSSKSNASTTATSAQTDKPKSSVQTSSAPKKTKPTEEQLELRRFILGKTATPSTQTDKLKSSTPVSTQTPGEQKKTPLTPEQIEARRWITGLSSKPNTSTATDKQTTVGQSGKVSISSASAGKQTTVGRSGKTSVSSASADKQTTVGRSGKASVSSASADKQTTVGRSGKASVSSASADKQTTVGRSGKAGVSSASADKQTTVGRSEKTSVSGASADRQTIVGRSGKVSVSSASADKHTTVGQSGKVSISSASADKQTTETKSTKTSNTQMTLNQQIESLRKKLKLQRASGTSQAEMEKTIKEAGKLIMEQVKKTKPFDLPADAQVDREGLVRTWNEFAKRFNLIISKNRVREYMALKPVHDKIKNEFDRLLPLAEEQLKQISRERARQLNNVLSQVRQIGASKEQLKRQFGTAPADVRAIMEEALSCYPTEWVEASIQYGRLKLDSMKQGRSYFNPVSGNISLNTKNYRCFTSAIHEFAHRLEQSVEGLLKSETEFYARRTAGEKLQLLRDLIPNSNYGRNEYARKDKFPEAYMGKDYGGLGYELVSVGFQWAYTDPLRLLQDEDLAQWIYGLLAIL